MQLKAVHSGMGSSLLDDVSRGGGGNQILFCGCRWTDGAAIVGEVVPVDGVRFRIVGKLLMLKDGCRGMRRPLFWDWYLSKDDGLGGGRELRDGVVVGNNCLSR